MTARPENKYDYLVFTLLKYLAWLSLVPGLTGSGKSNSIEVLWGAILNYHLRFVLVLGLLKDVHELLVTILSRI